MVGERSLPVGLCWNLLFRRAQAAGLLATAASRRVLSCATGGSNTTRDEINAAAASSCPGRKAVENAVAKDHLESVLPTAPFFSVRVILQVNGATSVSSRFAY